MSDYRASADFLRFEELLPFYIVGGLTGGDQSFMQSFISMNPSARSAVSFTMEISRIVRGTGMMRNPNLTLQKLLTSFNAARKASQGSGALSKLRSMGIKTSPPLIIAIVILGGQAVKYSLDHFENKQNQTVTAQSGSQVAVTLKEGADVGALGVLAQKYGGRIIHSAEGDKVIKYFVEIMDKTRLQAFIDALAGSGLVDSAAVVF